MNTPSICPLCNQIASCSLKETHIDTGTVYTLYDCPHCKAEFWWPLKNPGSTWYEHDERYADRNADPILKENKKHRWSIEYFPKGTTGTVLDVGCGIGNFLAYAVARGWEGWGIDFDRDAISAGEKTFGLKNLSVDDLNSFAQKNPDKRFDLITFFDVFEHLDNHNEFTDEVKALLAEGGHISLSVPYRHGWRWLMPHDLPPRHLTRWDEASLQTFFERHGFTDIHFKRLPASLSFLIMKFRFRYGAWASFGLVGAVKKREAATLAKTRGSVGKSPKVMLMQFLARTKDAVLFGIPALMLWCALLPLRGRYTDVWMVAKKK